MDTGYKHAGMTGCTWENLQNIQLYKQLPGDVGIRFADMAWQHAWAEDVNNAITHRLLAYYRRLSRLRNCSVQNPIRPEPRNRNDGGRGTTTAEILGSGSSFMDINMEKICLEETKRTLMIVLSVLTRNLTCWNVTQWWLIPPAAPGAPEIGSVQGNYLKSVLHE